MVTIYFQHRSEKVLSIFNTGGLPSIVPRVNELVTIKDKNYVVKIVKHEFEITYGIAGDDVKQVIWVILNSTGRI